MIFFRVLIILLFSASFNSQVAFSFDSVALAANYKAKRDSSFSVNDHKGFQQYNTFYTKVDGRIYKPGRIYKLTVLNQYPLFTFSPSYLQISMRHDSVIFTCMTEETVHSDHVPRQLYITEQAIIDELSNAPQNKPITIEYKILTREYRHKKSNGAPCIHVFDLNPIKITALKH